jgi:DNA-binding MurR/RpiR family transcriptional regulator
MGFPGYPELRLALAAAAQAGRVSGWEDIGSDIGPRDTLDEIIKKIAHADARAVEETSAQLSTDALGAVVNAVVRARRIDIYGVGASAFVALDLQHKLHRIQLMVYAWPDPHSAVTSAALLRSSDVAIGISHTGMTADTVGSLQEASKQRATTVAITNFPGSPIARVADHVLTTAACETTFRSGAMASRISALTVVDCLFVAVAQRNYQKAMRALDRTHAAIKARR